LLRYGIIDTVQTSATHAQHLFNDIWDALIEKCEDILESDPPNKTNNNKEVKIYAMDLFKTAYNIVRVSEAIKLTKSKLEPVEFIYKKRVLDLAKVFCKQIQNGENALQTDQSEYNYIITFISHIFDFLFKDLEHIKSMWGEKSLRAAAALLNKKQKDDSRRRSGSKIDLIMMLREIQLEFLVMEVSGPPLEDNHTHFVGDRNKIAKNLKILLNFIRTTYPGNFQEFRKIKLYGIQIY
ncbi:8422_t:CDS:2, partial [Paraglomus brasilianum]